MKHRCRHALGLQEVRSLKGGARCNARRDQRHVIALAKQDCFTDGEAVDVG